MKFNKMRLMAGVTVMAAGMALASCGSLSSSSGSQASASSVESLPLENVGTTASSDSSSVSASSASSTSSTSSASSSAISSIADAQSLDAQDVTDEDVAAAQISEDEKNAKDEKLATGVNMRSSASASDSSNILQVINSGETVKVVSEENGWYKIIYNGKEGYIKKGFLEGEEQTDEDSSQDEDSEQTETKKAGQVTAQYNVVFRTSPEERSDNSNLIGTIYKGTNVTPISTTSNGWYKIQFNGFTGYVKANLFQ